jgi:DNA-binding transcriptional LysR family regulator
MDLNAIAVFVKVVQAGSFSAAARRLGMPNTTVSAKVAALERRLGVTLIHRTTRKLNVTPQGREYFERCLRGMQDIEAGELLLTSGAREPSGLLRITAPNDVAHHVLPAVVSSYLRAHQQVRIELVVTNHVVDLVVEGIDLAIRATQLKDSTLIARPFLAYCGGLWASRDYLQERGQPQSPEQLTGHEMLSFSRLPRQKLMLTDGRKKTELILNCRTIADDLETLRAFVLHGAGIGPLPDFLARNEPSLIQVLPEWTWARASLAFVYPGRRFVLPTVRTFIDTALGLTGAAH